MWAVMSVKKGVAEKSEIVTSPCVGICSLDDEDVCIGCQRTGQEISSWGGMTESEKKLVLKNVAQREREKYGW
jgi:hypothetical protein